MDFSNLVSKPWFPYAVAGLLALIIYLILNSRAKAREAARLEKEEEEKIERQKQDLLTSGYKIIKKLIHSTTESSGSVFIFGSAIAFGWMNYERPCVGVIEVYSKPGHSGYIFWENERRETPDSETFSQVVVTEDDEFEFV